MRTGVIEWLNRTLPNHNLPLNALDEESRTLLSDGTLRYRLMNKLGLGPAIEEPAHCVDLLPARDYRTCSNRWEMIDVCDALEPMSPVFEGEKGRYRF
ncbi:hypothetical protein Tco_0868574 [Tanacetum coccineum]